MIRLGAISVMLAALVCLALKGEASSIGNVLVVGGALAKQGQFPHIATLLKRELTGGRTFFCGASLISPSWVITTADCLRSHTVATTSVRTGELDMDHTTEFEQLVSAKRFVVHPDYVPTTALNNIALVELNEPVVEIPGIVRPISLPGNATVIYPGTECTVAGWGSTTEGGATSKKLLFTYLPFVNDEECRNDYPERFDVSSQICAGFSQGGVGACGLDYGGPLTCGDDPNVLHGVVSYSNGCAKPGLPGVYNRVSNYVDWINSYVNANSSITSN